MKQSDLMVELGLVHPAQDMAWRDHAVCIPHDPNWFHPEVVHKKESPEYKQFTKMALAICEHCPVKAPCLEYGMTQRYGIWGGKTSGQRDSMRRRNIRIINITSEDRA
jgi:hypothetical protein